ncbi:MAG: ribosomal-protein-alanine acetyltransferase [Gemmatimonadetes bacterium]|nr:ribosomal-protein-alanine acetyltransferase [Gemmatimonadota bacterium]
MMQDLLRVRDAVIEDIPQIARIEGESFADPWSAKSFLDSLANDRMRFLVAEDGMPAERWSSDESVIVGYVIALVLTEEAEIADIAVAPAERKRGIGGLLLDSVIIHLGKTGVRTLYLEVRESNVAAQVLYKSRGFLQVGRRRGYYRHPVEDALLLRRDIGVT